MFGLVGDGFEALQRAGEHSTTLVSKPVREQCVDGEGHALKCYRDPRSCNSRSSGFPASFTAISNATSPEMTRSAKD